METARESRAETVQELHWRGKSFSIKEPKVLSLLLTAQEYERALTKPHDSFDETMSLYGQLLNTYHEAQVKADEAVKTDTVGFLLIRHSMDDDRRPRPKSLRLDPKSQQIV